ncbi:serine hydrolase domain-containing protein [Paenibacillus sp. PL91]|uniref:serine hydrolase domain-containing protein n=1 Tax=Paenibacillus sp. PL91 TaxID=2729538 RepID=UPI00145E1A40|nr:serine hydrolase [Paenibacillus sp. PL91]MBC9199403.1 serine hydrolase [Paenibacillus sp. PL91]
MNPNDMEAYRKQLSEWKMKTVIVLKGQQLLGEWYESGKDSIGALYSCTKSILSALIGIAIDKGFLNSVEEPITDYLEHPPEISEALSQITIKHLLTMTPGFDWPDFDKPYKAFKAAQDPIKFVFEQPLISEPGTAFAYNSGGSHLLSAILTNAVGMPALSFAKDYLFGPLGFHSARWMERGGINEGGTGLYLYGKDLARIGSLFAKNGRFDNKQLLSSAWVESSTKLHHRGLLQYEPPIYGGYGYHWWHSPESHNGQCDCYFAFGHGGQYLLVAPEHELVIVIRKQVTKRNDAIWSRQLLFEHLIPASIEKKSSSQA